MSVPSQVRATALLDFPAVALEAGIDPFAALREAGVDPAILSRPEMTIPADRVAWLLDGVAERAGIADLGIRIAMRRRLANLGVAGLVLGQQPTVRDALAMAERYSHLLNDALSLHIEDDGATATLMVGVAISSSAPGRQTRELALSAYVHLFRLLLGDSWSPLSVHFSHPAPRGPTLHRLTGLSAAALTSTGSIPAPMLHSPAMPGPCWMPCPASGAAPQPAWSHA
jgi:Arabinose-binding domain of AraC transcription regulator, N-term